MPQPKPRDPATILLVDDNPTNLQVLLQTLDGQGYNLLVAKNGEVALDIAQKAKPAMILLDVMMPGIDGFETCRRLKQNPETAEAAVIFLSALGETGDKVRGLDLGAVDYITKPIQADEVLARVNTHLTIHQLNAELQARYGEIESELEVIANVQRGLLPKPLPDITGLKLAAFYATSRQVGGDYYDVVELPDDRWGILVADVAGHGTPAAVVMAMTYSLFHAYPGPALDPAVVIRFLNDNLSHPASRTFVTALYAVYEAKDRSLLVARAGHWPPLVYRHADGAVEDLDCPGLFPLGIMPYEEVPTSTHRLEPGDRILFYTDGVIERANPNGELYGMERLRPQLGHAGPADAQQTVDALMRDVEAFARDLPADDDQTLLLGVVE